MKVGVIMGGISSEREISLNSGNSIMENIDKNKYDVVPVVIDEKADIINKVKDLDFALLALHGKFGEDGTVQGLMQLANIPVIGCGILSSALCMDKQRAHELVKNQGIKVADAIVIKNTSDYSKAISTLQFPLFVKPVKAGSSYGISKVLDIQDLKPAIDNAFKYDNEVIIEEAILGREVG